MTVPASFAGAIAVRPHSPLPFRVPAEAARQMVEDRDGLPVARCDTRDTGVGNPRPASGVVQDAAYIAHACTAYPLLLVAIATAVHALRSYPYGNSSPDLAEEIADACERAAATLGAR